MQKQWLVLSFCLIGCSNETFTTAIEKQDVDVAVELPDASDAGTPEDNVLEDVLEEDAASCEKYSCRPGCGNCDTDAGLKCGAGGPHTCGSTNCSRWLASFDAGFGCNEQSDMPVKFGCSRTMPDVLPRCNYMGSNNGSRWYCCAQF